jgi:hypothetical protein
MEAPAIACRLMLTRKSRRKLRESECSYSLSTTPPRRTGQGAFSLERLFSGVPINGLGLVWIFRFCRSSLEKHGCQDHVGEDLKKLALPVFGRRFPEVCRTEVSEMGERGFAVLDLIGVMFAVAGDALAGPEQYEAADEDDRQPVVPKHSAHRYYLALLGPRGCDISLHRGVSSLTPRER